VVLGCERGSVLRPTTHSPAGPPVGAAATLMVAATLKNTNAHQASEVELCQISCRQF